MNFYATPNRAGASRSAAIRGGDPSALGMPFVLVFAALSFNFFLCFVNTNVVGISGAHVMGAEVLIVGLTFLVAHRSIGQNQIVLICGMLLYLMIMSSLRALAFPENGFDIKTFRDYMIPIAFFLLGTRITNLASADSIVRICAIVVTIFAIFEYFFLETYLRYFNIIAYYVSRGSVETSQIEWMSTTLFVSGIRPEGRTLFPFLGDHRVSSIFLEPVSPGNFAVTLFFWALVRSYSEKKFYYGIFLMAIFLTIMADNRFGVFLCATAFVASLIPSRYLRIALIILPFVMIPVLLGVRFWHPDAEIDNSFSGRFLSSGATLAGFDFWNWIGVGKDAEDLDSGYAYTIGRIGIVGLAAFWALFMSLKSTNASFQMFRGFCALYFAAILCVSYSPFTIKTAGLLWFLLGALSVVRGNSRVPGLATHAAPVATVRHSY